MLNLNGKDFSLSHHIQTGSGGHPMSYQVLTGGSLPGACSTHKRDEYAYRISIKNMKERDHL
jgi:hypothetical protein